MKMTNAPAEVATWTTSDGRVVPIPEMETSHLFFTLRMFWNHYAPEDLKLHPYRKKILRMSREYILTKMRLIAAELATRPIPEQFAKQLAFMQDNSAQFDAGMEKLAAAKPLLKARVLR